MLEFIVWLLSDCCSVEARRIDTEKSDTSLDLCQQQ